VKLPRSLFAPEYAAGLAVVEDIENPDALARLFDVTGPDVVINCIAVGRPAPADPMRSIEVYSVLPRRLSHLCKLSGSRLIQISSDGVFSGSRGGYTEDDLPDANDAYGVSNCSAKFPSRTPSPCEPRSSAMNCNPGVDC